MPFQHLTVVALVFLAASACGGSPASSTSPSPSPSPSPTPRPERLPAGTVLTIVSGETNRPVSGAMVKIVDRTQTTDAIGQVTLSQAAGIGDLVEIASAGYLSRQTLLRLTSESQFSLWPQTSPTGLTEPLTQELVYTVPGNGPGAVGSPLGGRPLSRIDPSVRRIAVVAPALALVSSGVTAIAMASGRLTAATGGQIAYVPDLQGANGRIEIVVDPSSLPPGSSASANATYNAGGYITGGRLTVRDGSCLTSPCDITAPRSNGVTIVRTLVHEMGHLIGFGHTNSRSVMNGGCSGPGDPACVNVDPRIEDFNDAEKLLVKLMLQRRIGNRFPDNDRDSR
jgi:hypothetical protein